MIRFGVIGLRRGQSFLRVTDVVEGARIAALFDIDEARVARAAAEIGALPFVDYAAFLEADIDAVVIASPMPFHAEQAMAALGAGKHVLCEVTACTSLDEARALVAAARASDAVYMMAENSRYYDEVELLKRMHDDGRFGDIYFAEGEYLHDCRDLWYTDDDRLTWRGQGLDGVYCTHSLGPLLYITGDRVERVSSMAVPGGKVDARSDHVTMDLLQMETAAGRTLRVRVDSASPRPHQTAYYALQGTAGCFESWRGGGDASKVWLADEHEASHVGQDSARWHPVSGQAERYIPDRLSVPASVRAGGHGATEYWMLRDFLAAVRQERESPIDVFRALDYTLPGIVSRVSAARGGAPCAVPDPRTFE